jgi:hypothetical protein
VFVRRGLLPADDAQAMGRWQQGGGFSVDASVRIEATDRAGRERLLRYCARPPFALDRLRERDGEHLIYEPPKPGGREHEPARLPARGHPGVGARPKLPQQACGAARCHRKSTLDSTRPFGGLSLLASTWRDLLDDHR